jgi:hypothetical protein
MPKPFGTRGSVIDIPSLILMWQISLPERPLCRSVVPVPVMQVWYERSLCWKLVMQAWYERSWRGLSVLGGVVPDGRGSVQGPLC